MTRSSTLPIAAVALVTLAAGCAPADDAPPTSEEVATEVGDAVARSVDVVAALEAPMAAALEEDGTNAATGLRARIEDALALLVVDPACISASWVLNTATVRFADCELVSSGAPLDGAISLRVRPLVPSVVVTMDALTLGQDSVAGSITARPVGALADLTFAVDVDLTFAGAERSLAFAGTGTAGGQDGVTISGTGSVVAPELVADATVDAVHWDHATCLPSSGEVELVTEAVHGFITFLPTTPETGEVLLRFPPLPAAPFGMFQPCE